VLPLRRLKMRGPAGGAARLVARFIRREFGCCLRVGGGRAKFRRNLLQADRAGGRVFHFAVAGRDGVRVVG
jgi:hypothetical protein